MTPPDGDFPLHPQAEELILCQDNKYVCETYIFEPSVGEEHFGWLFAAGETAANQGIGSELIETVVTSIQKEYYRDPSRTSANSFEMALHQANLILHDAAEQGMRDWMGYFHMAIGILVGDQLHVSVAGGGQIFLARKANLTEVSLGLAHFPITNALQTFSQVASGEVKARDTLFFATANFHSLFSMATLGRLTLDPAAATISSRLANLYKDTGQQAPVAIVTVALLPQYVSARSHTTGTKAAPSYAAARRAASGFSHDNIRPRQPLVIRRSFLQSTLLLVMQMFTKTWQMTRRYIWPVIKQGSRHGGRALVKAGQVTGRNIQVLAQRGRQSFPMAGEAASGLAPAQAGRRLVGSLTNLKTLPTSGRAALRSLPTTSKILALTAVILLIALAASLLLLQRKRTADQYIQQASEVLHEAQTKVEAADTALIYDNREQAKGLLGEANQLLVKLKDSQLYQDETAQLQQQITKQTDRLQRVSRAVASSLPVVGETVTLIAGTPPKNVFLVNGSIYTVNPDNNSIVKVTPGQKPDLVHQTTQGIGFITSGAVHPSDKTITFNTTTPGIALFDAAKDTLLAQDIQFPSSDPNILDVAVFGNRLYVLDAAAQNIFVFNKTLRGYSSGEPWIVDESFPKGDIKSFGIDGNIFTLLKDGSIKRLFKGKPADYVQEKVEPSLATATKIIAAEDLQYLYLLDTANKRIVVYGKEGALIRQIFVEGIEQLTDVAIDPAEKKAYLLDGTRILELSLVDASETTPQ